MSGKIGSRDQLMGRIGGLASQVVNRAPAKDRTTEVLDQVVKGDSEASPALSPMIAEFKKLQGVVERFNKGIEDPADHLDLSATLASMANKARRSVVDLTMNKAGEVNGPKLRKAILAEVGNAVIGNSDVIELMLLGQLCGGHILVEGPVGAGKTHTAKAFSKVAGLEFGRQQFVADLLPGDITGVEMPDENRQLKPQFGSIAESNVYLADEINRAPPKAQGALLEAMAESQVTVGKETRKLDELFTVIATMNPDHHEGTFPLTEANRDRFFFKIVSERPSRDEQVKIMQLKMSGFPELREVVSKDMLLAARKQIQNVRVEIPVMTYIAELVRATWPAETDVDDIKGQIGGDGASERASLAMLEAARARAFLNGREYVTPDDVAELAPHVLRHRIEVAPAARNKTTADELIAKIIDHVEQKLGDELRPNAGE